MRNAVIDQVSAITVTISSRPELEGAYIFSRPRKNDTVKKERKASTKIPIAPLDITTSSVSEEATISGPIPDSAKIKEPIPENHWPKVFKW